MIASATTTFASTSSTDLEARLTPPHDAMDLSPRLSRDVFERLALDQMDRVYRMAMHLARNPDTASDLVQDTYVKAFKAWERFELREAGIRPWLFRILRNTYYSFYAKARRAAVTGQGERFDEMAGPSSQAEVFLSGQGLDWQQVDDRLKHAIEQLPEHHRQVLLLWAVEGLKYRQIAQVLDIALGTVMSRLHRARAILTEQLGDLAAEYGLKAAV